MSDNNQPNSSQNHGLAADTVPLAFHFLGAVALSAGVGLMALMYVEPLRAKIPQEVLAAVGLTSSITPASPALSTHPAATPTTAADQPILTGGDGQDALLSFDTPGPTTTSADLLQNKEKADGITDPEILLPQLTAPAETLGANAPHVATPAPALQREDIIYLADAVADESAETPQVIDYTAQTASPSQIQILDLVAMEAARTFQPLQDGALDRIAKRLAEEDLGAAPIIGVVIAEAVKDFDILVGPMGLEDINFCVTNCP